MLINIDSVLLSVIQVIVRRVIRVTAKPSISFSFTLPRQQTVFVTAGFIIDISAEQAPGLDLLLCCPPQQAGLTASSAASAGVAKQNRRLAAASGSSRPTAGSRAGRSCRSPSQTNPSSTSSRARSRSWMPSLRYKRSMVAR